MLDSHYPVILFGLAAAATWGAGDFSGALASRKTHVFSVVALSQVAGVFFLGIMAIASGELPPPAGDLLLGGLAGLCGMVGLMSLYRGLADGRMGLVAPIAALTTAALPVIAGVFLEGTPSVKQGAGFGLGLLAVWFLSRPNQAEEIRVTDLKLPLLAGVFFGLFFIIIDRVADTAIFWPLVAARIASITTLFLVMARRGQWRPVSGTGLMLMIGLAGILDASGNAFFGLATRAGRLDIAAVLSSLYPASTVLLARLALKERLSRRQVSGLLLALVALALFSSEPEI